MENKFNLFKQEFINQYCSAAGALYCINKILRFFSIRKILTQVFDHLLTRILIKIRRRFH